MPPGKITAATVRADFNDLPAVVHYTRAAHELGLWASERILIERFLPDRTAPLIEAGCGAGRVTLGLWALGYRELVAFDFAEELVDQARSLAAERLPENPPPAPAADISPISPIRPMGPIGPTGPIAPAPLTFLHADATALLAPGGPLADHFTRARPRGCTDPRGYFGGALFPFNGLMQIPGRAHRREALRGLAAVCAPGAPLLFTTHDRDATPTERALWRLETIRWTRGEQDPRLVEFGDRYFEDEAGRTFMHLPDRREILEDLAATGWTHTFDALRPEIAKESRAVRDFSDECRFWSAVRETPKIAPAKNRKT